MHVTAGEINTLFANIWQQKEVLQMDTLKVQNIIQTRHPIHTFTGGFH